MEETNEYLSNSDMILIQIIEKGRHLEKQKEGSGISMVNEVFKGSSPEIKLNVMQCILNPTMKIKFINK